MTQPKSENDELDEIELANVEPATVERERESMVTSRRYTRVLSDGLQFGKYRVVRLIGIGGMSEIYEAIHLGLKKRVALKVMRRDLAESVEGRQRFIAEGQNAARLRHTNVVDVTDVGEVDELPYLVMNLLEGEDLGRVFDRQGRIPVAEIIDLLLPVASAVAHGHEKGVVHRDLKPDNIFLHREGCRVIPKVLDFGVSRVMSARRITLNSSVFGTPHYMSPEQARGGPTDARTDQYSLGVILYEGVTGTLPRDSANPIELLHAVAYDSFRPPSELFELPEELEAVILRAMAREPDARFDTMRDLAMALVPFASESSREYWSLELGLVTGDRVSEHRVPQIVRHPSPAPQLPAVPDDRGDRSGPVRKIGDDIVVAAPSVPRLGPPPPPRPELLQAQLVQPSQAAREVELGPVRRHRRRERLFWVALAAVPLVAVGGLLVWNRSPRGSAPAAAVPEAHDTFEVDVRVEPTIAELHLDGKLVAVGHYAARLRRDGSFHELKVSAPGWIDSTVRFRDEPPPREIRLPRNEPPIAQPAEPSAPAIAKAPKPHPKPVRAAEPDEKPAPARSSAPKLAREPAPEPELAAEGTSKPNVVEAHAANPRVAVIDPGRPHVRLVDEHEPKIQLVE